MGRRKPRTLSHSCRGLGEHSSWYAYLAATTEAVTSLQRASPSVPIVFVGMIDPVGAGLITSMARPGGNATGFTVFEYLIAAKWMELLREIALGVRRVAVLRDANVASGIGQFAAAQVVAPTGIELSAIDMRDAAQVENAIAAFAREPNGGVIVTAGAFGANNPQVNARLPLGITCLRFTRSDILSMPAG